MTPSASDFWCRAAWQPVDKSGMRPGYDCRCSGCMASLGKPMDPAVLRDHVDVHQPLATV